MVSISQRVCLLCEFPAAESGVRLSDVDAEKWAEWCRRTLDTDFEIVSDAEVRIHVCQFCIWDARLAHEGSLDDCGESEKKLDWWTGHDDDHFFQEYFYKKPVFRPCKVVLEKILSEFDHLAIEDIAVKDCHHSNAHLRGKIQACQKSSQVENKSDIKSADGKSTTKIFQCSVCQIIFYSKSSLNRHIKSIHKNVVRCRSLLCSTYFLTEDERKQHEQKFHFTGPYIKMLKCIYCGALLSNSTSLFNHIKAQHKEAIKCDYNQTCANYFQTESEKNEHIFNEHTRGLQLKNTPVKCIYCDIINKSKYKLRLHVNDFHKDVRIKCRVRGCVVFFLSEKEREEHFIQVHQNAESLKKWQCPKCSLKCNMKQHLRTHLQNVHSNKAKMNSTFKCKQCPKSFPAKFNLNVHVNRAHAERCTCQYCGKIMQKESMMAHFLGGACKPIPTF